jgi:hypothetical protein
MTRYQWTIYISEARICELDVSFQFISDWMTGWHFAETIGQNLHIEVGRGFEPGEAGLYVYLECLDRDVVSSVAKSVVKILNRIAAGARGSSEREWTKVLATLGDKGLVTDRFVFEDAQISVIKDGE